MRFLPPKTHTTHTRKPRLWRGFLVFPSLQRARAPFPHSPRFWDGMWKTFLFCRRKRGGREICPQAWSLEQQGGGSPRETGGTGKGFSAMPCRGLSGKRTPRGHCPAAEKREAMPLGRKTTGNRGFSPLTGGEKGDKVFPDSKRQRTGRVAAGRSQEKGRVVQVPALRRQ